MVAAAYRLETGVRNALADRARRRGWTTAALAYPGYGGGGRARVLGRLLLAPSGIQPQDRRNIAGWRRLLTLEQPGGEVDISLGGVRVQASADEAGVIDVTVPVDLPPGTAEVRLHVDGRPTVAAPVRIAAPDALVGIVCDIDDTVWVTGLRHPVRAAWRTLALSSSGRQPVKGMSALIEQLVDGAPAAPLIYLSNGPWNLAGPITRFLERNGFPPGALLMTDWGITPRAWFRDGKAHKRAALERVAEDFPGVRWLLVGDDGEHDPDIYRDFATRHPRRVRAIALRTVARSGMPEGERHARVGDAPIVIAPDGAELYALLRDALPADAPGTGGQET